MSVISIPEFAAEYPVKKRGGGTDWYSCRVVGVCHEGAFDEGQFIIITEGEDGNLYTSAMLSVRRAEDYPPLPGAGRGVPTEPSF